LSGVSVHKCGGWVERLYGKKRYVKMHFAVDVKKKEVLAVDATTDDIHDSEINLCLDAFAIMLGRISESCMIILFLSTFIAA